MPFMTEDEVGDLLGAEKSADSELDLRGIEASEALGLLKGTIRDQGENSPRSVLVRIDPATADSGETLFLPVGRALLEAKRKGLVSHCHPLMELGAAGFYVELPASEESTK